MNSINKSSAKPYYQQIVEAIEQGIARGEWTRGDKLPSITQWCLRKNISRDTVLYAFDILKKRGLIQGISGKGYFVKGEDWQVKQRFFLLFDELNAFKEDLYHTFMSEVNERAQVDVYFHHFNFKLFQKLIRESVGNYHKYIIMPGNMEHTTEVIQMLPKEDTYLLDQSPKGAEDIAGIFQSFRQDIYLGLMELDEKLTPYEQVVLIYPGEKEPIGIVEGFEEFCRKKKLGVTIYDSFHPNILKSKHAYFVVRDRDMVALVEEARSRGWKMTEDYGVISFNDTPLKKIVGKGITTISTDFQAMGKKLAHLLMANKRERIHNESKVLIRKSL